MKVLGARLGVDLEKVLKVALEQALRRDLVLRGF
jgi:hypothetical protein